jgi:outer membrane protein OmpA-like peptidoglycan-associated protein
VEELLARAERVLRQPVPPASPLSRLRWPLVGAGLVAVIVLVAALSSGGDTTVSGQTTAVPLASTTSAVATTVPIVITLPPNTPSPNSTAAAPASADSSATTSTTQAPATPRTTAFGVPARAITFLNGALVLQGEVADQATADAIHSALAASFGTVVDQLQIVSDAPFTDADPIAAGAAVRFVDGQPTTDVASLKFLDQLADLFARHPNITADIHVTADRNGAALARQRGGVIRQYLSSKGVALDRLTSTGDGDTGALAQMIVILHHLPG